MILVVLVSLFGLTIPPRGTPVQKLIRQGFTEAGSEDTHAGLRSRWLIRSHTPQLGGEVCTNVEAIGGETDQKFSVGTSLSHQELLDALRRNRRCTLVGEDYFLCEQGASDKRVFICDDMLLFNQNYENPGAREESCARALSIAGAEPGAARPKLCRLPHRSGSHAGRGEARTGG